MKYLFYDCEFASTKGSKYIICEFGYVVTDENFNVTERDNLIINPDIKSNQWDWYALRKILTRKKSEYISRQTFPSFYDKIRKLISGSDYVFGHTIKSSDAVAVNYGCERYGLTCLDYDFYDVKILHQKYTNAENEASVEKILEQFGIKGEENNHSSDTDAYNTMLGLKKMAETSGKSLEEFLKEFPEAKDRSENYKVLSIEESKAKKSMTKKKADAGRKKDG